jgi:hypothetical protein
MKAVLIVKQEFTSGGVAYGIDDVVKDEDLARWPEDALARRLTEGFVTYGAGDNQDQAEAMVQLKLDLATAASALQDAQAALVAEQAKVVQLEKDLAEAKKPKAEK